MASPVDTVRQAIADLGLEPRLLTLEAEVPTAAAAAEQLGCEVGAIANSLIFDANGSPVLIIASGAHRVDRTKVAAELSMEKLRRASPDFVLEHTGQEVGGVAPTGHPQRITTLIDAELANFDEVWAGGGDQHTMLATTVTELVTMTRGEIRAVR